MQQVSLIYLKSLVADNAFQPEGIKLDACSHTTAILIVFLSAKEHQGIDHVHISFVVQHKGCHLYIQDWILPIMTSIETDLKKVRDRHAQNKDQGRVCSYSLLIANYGGVLAVPTDFHIAWCIPPCVMMMHRNRITSTQQPVLQGCTHAPAFATTCFSMLIWIQSTGEPTRAATSSSPVVHSAGLFLETIMPCNHQGPLIDHNTGKPYPMAAAGDFWLMDPIFPGSPGDSLLFKEDDLAQLKRKGFHVPTYREEKPQPTVPNEDKHKSPWAKENLPSSSQEESHKTSGRNSRALSPWAPDSTSCKKPFHWGKHSPSAKEQIDSCNTKEHHASSSRNKDRSHSDKSSKCSSDKEGSSTPHKHTLSSPPFTGSREYPQKEPHVDEPPVSPVRVHIPTTGAHLEV